jgi:hypothetical protein
MGCVPGRNPEERSAVHIYVIEALLWLWFRKRQVYRISWTLHASNSRKLLALASKYAIDARIGGCFKPTNLELNQTHLNTSRHYPGFITNWLSWPDIRNTEKWVNHNRASGWLRKRSFEHMSGDGEAQNCQCVEECCRTSTEDIVGTLVGGKTCGYMGLNWPCCKLWRNMNLPLWYLSWKSTLFSSYSVVLGLCSKVSSRLGNVVCRTSLSAVLVCWITICMQPV